MTGRHDDSVRFDSFPEFIVLSFVPILDRLRIERQPPFSVGFIRCWGNKILNAIKERDNGTPLCGHTRNALCSLNIYNGNQLNVLFGRCSKTSVEKYILPTFDLLKKLCRMIKMIL